MVSNNSSQFTLSFQQFCSRVNIYTTCTERQRSLIAPIFFVLAILSNNSTFSTNERSDMARLVYFVLLLFSTNFTHRFYSFMYFPTRKFQSIRISMTSSNIVTKINIHCANIEKSLALFSRFMKVKQADTSSIQLLFPAAEVYEDKMYPEVILQSQPTLSIFKRGDAFHGLGLKSGSAEAIFSQLDSILIRAQYNTYSYGASLIPDEDEMTNVPVQYGRFVDFDDNEIEIGLIDQHQFPAAKIILNVLNLEESIDFYVSVLGMSLLRKRSNVMNFPKHASISAYLGYSNTEKDEFCIELVYNYAVEKLEHGSHPVKVSLRLKIILFTPRIHNFLLYYVDSCKLQGLKFSENFSVSKQNWESCRNV